MFPALRIELMILPPNMVANLSQAMFLTGQYASGILQAALADFIEEGHFTTHLGRMRRLYGKRREEFLVSCQSELGEWLDPAPTIPEFSRCGIAAQVSTTSRSPCAHAKTAWS